VAELRIRAHDRSYRINDPGGLIGKSLRAGVPYEARVLQHIYRKGLIGLAVDIGASVGNHTLWFAAICGLRVIAVEPLDFERLRANVALNPDLDIEVWPWALGETYGCGTVIGAPAHAIGDSFPADGVKIQPLDGQDIGEPVVLLKIDVEGMEPEVLRGAERTIRNDRPLIFAEAQDEAADERVADILEPLGYTRGKVFGATPLWEWIPA